MAGASLYEPRYAKSWALVIGIDRYRHVSPLAHAGSDAEGVGQVLRRRLGFPDANITLLLDEGATREAILSAYMKYAGSPEVAPDDRILVFFAGHGHTVSGRRGEAGFLVPVDGRIADLATLPHGTV